MISQTESHVRTSVFPSLEVPVVISIFCVGTVSVVERDALVVIHPPRTRVDPLPCIAPENARSHPEKLLPEPMSSPLWVGLFIPSHPEKLLMPSDPLGLFDMPPVRRDMTLISVSLFT